MENNPVVSAEKYIRYKIQNGHIKNFTAPEIVLVCYQQSTLKYFQEKHVQMQESPSFSNLYLLDENKVGILAGWGMGAPALANKVEQLIALGVKKFLAVGIAGSLMDRHPVGDFILCTRALAEDGVAHHYLDGQDYAPSSPQLMAAWKAYSEKNQLPPFHEAGSWSFSAIFKESPAHIQRVVNLGYDVVEMEAATLNAICQEKGAQSLSLFVISDSITLDTWTPHIKEPIVRRHLHQLADWALSFSRSSD
jgi:uridine phosphorylase